VKRLFRMTSWVLTVGVWMLLVSWAIGRFVSDRFLLTQVLSWVPALAYAVTIPVLLALSWLAALMGRPNILASFAPDDDVPIRHLRIPRAAAKSRLAAGLVTLAVGGFSATVDHRLLRALREPPTFTQEAKRLVFWNAAVDFMGDYAARLTSTNPDFIAIANPAAYCEWDMLRAQAGENSDARRWSRLAFISPYPIVRWGATSLGVEGARERFFDGNIRIDRGEAMFVEVDTGTEFEGSLVVWIIDLPSDVNLPRMKVMNQAAATIAGFQGPAFQPGKNDIDQPLTLETPGFPAPDIIVGDFNTPRGAASLDQIRQGLPHAFDICGYGLESTWHRSFPFWAIDHVFAGRRVHPASYNSIDVGAGQHLLQIVDLIPAGR